MKKFIKINPNFEKCDRGPDSWAPGPVCPGPNCPPPKHDKLGPRQLGPGVQLSGAQLSGAQLSGARSSGAQFAQNPFYPGTLLLLVLLATSLYKCHSIRKINTFSENNTSQIQMRDATTLQNGGIFGETPKTRGWGVGVQI